MGPSWRTVLGAVLLLLTAPVAAQAQLGPGGEAKQPRSCRQVLPADARRIVNTLGQEMYYFRDPVRVLCTGGIRLEADSAVMNRTASTVQLVGNVVYRDSTRQLMAEWANYLGSVDELLARGNVMLTDLANGSVVTGDNLDYRRESEERPTSLVIVRGDRAHALMPPEARTGGGGAVEAGGTPADTAVPIEVWSNRMEFEGQTLFRAEGGVDLRRGDMTGGSQRAVFDQDAERMTLLGDAHVENDRYRLQGQRIDAFLEGDALREVVADEHANLLTQDLAVRSEKLRIGLVDGELDRLEAWNPPDTAAGDSAAASPPAHRAIAAAKDFRLRADSIDVRADSGRVQEVRAVGRAFGERDVDSVAVGLPAVAARDWIQGDTIIGFFAPDTAAGATATAGPGARGDEPVRPGEGEPGRLAEADSARGNDMTLERIEVVGGLSPALSLYRMDSGKDGGGRSINFMKAERITLYMSQGDVASVQADGPIRGVYLDPDTGRPMEPPVPPPAPEGGGA